MSKRTYEEKLDHYIRKMEKLKEKFQSKRQRRRHISSSSSDPDNNLVAQDVEPDTWDITQGLHDPIETDVVSEQQMAQRPPTIQLTQASSAAELSAPSIDPTLDPDILSALGEATDQGPTWGLDIHTNLVQLWNPLLKNGMTREQKDTILKQYLIPSNCTLLQAPKLNIEISAVVLETARLRDKKVETNQQQLGVGITAMSRAMTSLITSDNKIEAIKTLSDGCRILCDLHHSQTQARIKMITPGLAKPFLNVIQESERDETLFGYNLPEKIKASKTIEKQGLQIQMTAPLARAAVTHATAPPRQYQGNWNGPPRYPTSRGGRGGQKRYPSSTPRPSSSTAMGAAAATMQPKASYSRSRAPPRH